MDSTLSRSQAKKECEVFREMLIDQVVDPCRAAVCSDKRAGAMDAARATQAQEALIQDVKPWRFQLEQYTADLLVPESSFESSDSDSGSASGGVNGGGRQMTSEHRDKLGRLLLIAVTMSHVMNRLLCMKRRLRAHDQARILPT